MKDFEGSCRLRAIDEILTTVDRAIDFLAEKEIVLSDKTISSISEIVTEFTNGMAETRN